MSKILKRPMFRIGGSANNEGIMSGVVPTRAGYAEPQDAANVLDNYQLDTSSDLYKNALRNAAILSQFAGPGRSQSDRLSDLLIRGGLKTMSETPRGNIFATVSKAYQEPVEQYLKSGEAEDAFQRQLRVAGITQAMTSEEAKAKYEKEAAIAKQQMRLKEKELYIAGSSDKARAFQNFDTLISLEDAGKKVIKSEIPVVGAGKVKTPDPKLLLRIPKDTIFPAADGALYQKTDNLKGFKIVTESGGEPDRPPATEQKTTAWERLKKLGDTGADVSKYGSYLYASGGPVDPRPWTKNSFYEKLSKLNKDME